MMGGGIFVDMR